MQDMAVSDDSMGILALERPFGVARVELRWVMIGYGPPQEGA